MKIVGTIVEFNPLHNGHCYFIQQVKQQSKADILVAVMSGSFTMRGELSVFDKFTKTKQALQAGIDLVIELPFCYSVQSADLFAEFAVCSLLNAHVDEIWIGSENNDPALFEKAYAQWQKKENQEHIKQLLKTGMSYKQATHSVLGLPSNDLLGFCYYKALQKESPNVPLFTIQRLGSGYFDRIPNEFASAYAIRNDLRLMEKYCPSFVDRNTLLDANMLLPFIQYRLQSLTANEIKSIFFAEEGMERWIQKNFSTAEFKMAFTNTASKRYTKSRIQRFLCYLLFNIHKEQMKAVLSQKIHFIRVLGYNQTGLDYLKILKKKTVIYTNLKNKMNPVLDMELKISSVLDVIYSRHLFMQEQRGPIFLDSSEKTE